MGFVWKNPVLGYYYTIPQEMFDILDLKTLNLKVHHAIFYILSRRHLAHENCVFPHKCQLAAT